MATTNKDQAKPAPAPKLKKGEIRRVFLRCTAAGDSTADKVGGCGHETKRVAARDLRSAEIELGKHAIAAHSRLVTVAVELRREERVLE